MMIKSRKIILVLVLCLGLFLTFTACWDYIELRERLIVTAFAVDAVDGGRVRAAVMVVSPESGGERSDSSGGKKAQRKTQIFTATGDTVFEAFRLIAMQSGRKLFLAHSKALIIGRQQAESGIEKVIDFFDRDAEPRRFMKIIITQDEGLELLSAQSMVEPIVADNLVFIEESMETTSMTADIDLHQFMKDISNDKREAFAGIIKVSQNKNPVSDGAAVFKNTKMVGMISPIEVRGLNWIDGKTKSGIVSFSLPNEPGLQTAIEVTNSSSKVEGKFINCKPVVNIHVRTEANIAEIRGYLDLSSQENWELIKKTYEKAVENEIKAVLYKAQKEYVSDIFGFSDKLYHADPKQWNNISQNWDAEFENLAVNISIEAAFKESGIILSPNLIDK